MATTNDVTGDVIATKTISEQYRSNYDAIFRKKPQRVPEEVTPEIQAIIDEDWHQNRGFYVN
jgi:hypothetical protein